MSVELPGVEENDIQLELDGDTLEIKGEKKQEKEEKENDFYRVERSYGSFQRTLSLPEDADHTVRPCGLKSRIGFHEVQ